MREQPTDTTWKITCHSADEAQALRQWLSSRIALDREFTDIARTVPQGVEQRRTEKHRLGNYFEAIRIVQDSAVNSLSFQLVFQQRPEAGRFWKDLMVNILQEMEASPQVASIDRETKGGMETATNLAMR